MANPNTQTYNLKIVRAALILTTSYVAGTTLADLEGFNQLNIFIKYVKGSLTSLQLKIEFSDDGATFYQETFQSISAGTATETFGEHTFAPAADQNFMLAIPIKCSAVRISGKGTGTVTSSSLAITAAPAVQ